MQKIFPSLFSVLVIFSSSACHKTDPDSARPAEQSTSAQSAQSPPTSPLLPEQELACGIDIINGTRVTSSSASIGADQPIRIIGWAMIPSSKSQPTHLGVRVIADIEGSLPATTPVSKRLPRPDISRKFSTPSDQNLGFFASLAAPTSPGKYELVVIGREGHRKLRCINSVELKVSPK